MFEWPQKKVTKSGYPGIAFRLKLILDAILEEQNSFSLFSFLGAYNKDNNPNKEVSESILDYLNKWTERIKRGEDISEGLYLDDTNLNLTERIFRLTDRIAAEAIEGAVPKIKELVKQKIQKSETQLLTDKFFDRIVAIKNDIPPYLPGDSINQSFGEILSASWVYQLIYGNIEENQITTNRERFNEYLKTCRITLKAIELAVFSQSPTCKKEQANSKKDSVLKFGVISGPTIKKRLFLPMDDPKKLTIVPQFDKCIQAASVDVHLGHWFKVARRTRLPSILLVLNIT
jgi:hypothetical protein